MPELVAEEVLEPTARVLDQKVNNELLPKAVQLLIDFPFILFDLLFPIAHPANQRFLSSSHYAADDEDDDRPRQRDVIVGRRHIARVAGYDMVDDDDDGNSSKLSSPHQHLAENKQERTMVVVPESKKKEDTETEMSDLHDVDDLPDAYRGNFGEGRQEMTTAARGTIFTTVKRVELGGEAMLDEHGGYSDNGKESALDAGYDEDMKGGSGDEEGEMGPVTEEEEDDDNGEALPPPPPRVMVAPAWQQRRTAGKDGPLRDEAVSLLPPSRTTTRAQRRPLAPPPPPSEPPPSSMLRDEMSKATEEAKTRPGLTNRRITASTYASRSRSLQSYNTRSTASTNSGTIPRGTNSVAYRSDTATSVNSQSTRGETTNITATTVHASINHNTRPVPGAIADFDAIDRRAADVLRRSREMRESNALLPLPPKPRK